jgi:arabinan endo-1,5-alpha-L-arabinosidase
MKPFLPLCLALFLAACAPQAQENETPSANAAPDAPVAAWPEHPIPTKAVLAHDPVMAEEDGRYYVFTTGPGITVWVSEDLRTWMRRPAVFDPHPAWVPVAIPDFQGHMWAPDIHHHNGLYYLYYSVSAFGRNTSAIGVATNTTLDSDHPAYAWVDHGKILQSFPGLTNWNAIDANVVEDANGVPFLSFGSFWSGLKIGELMPDRLGLKDCWQDLRTIASRVEHPDAPPPPGGYSPRAGPGMIEAPFIFRRDGFFYLFASIDHCCRGLESDYKMIVGRATNVLGPYLDREGIPLLEGGGTLLLAGDEQWPGVGHNAVYTFGGRDYIVFHGYDASTPRGLPRLRIERLVWDTDGWPVVLLGEMD